MIDHKERKKKIEYAYAKLTAALKGALEEKDSTHYCETPLLGYIGDWTDAENELRELKVCEGYYKTVLHVIAESVSEQLKADNMKLRTVWCLNHGCSFHSLYLDDGELQCSKCRIDFRRDSVDSIMARIEKNNLDNMTEEDHEKIRKLLGD